MSFWRPGGPKPASPAPGGATDPADFELDGERHRALPFFNTRDGLPLHQQRKQLPISKSRLEFLHAVETHRAVVLCGPTGCGKSTQLPQFLDEAGWTAGGYVVGVTLPRRLAVVTVAQRVAQEMNVVLGEDVGYKIRFDCQITPGKTRIEFMTEGVVLKEMLLDPLLTRFGVIVVDEVHERSVLTDLLLGLLRKISRKRPRLRIVVASATIDVDGFLRFFASKSSDSRPLAAPTRKRPRCGWDDASGDFYRQRQEEGDWRRLCSDIGCTGGDDAAPERDVCFLKVEGRLHAVTLHYLEEPACDYIETAVGTVMAIHDRMPEGDILVFLTGREEVERTCALLKERLAEARERAPMPQRKPKPLSPVPLHGSLQKEQQLKAFVPARRGSRKVVVSTNLAEASVTIEGIVYVVDACLVKLDAFCPYNGTSYLNIVPCSRSSARQRAGRAGRTRPGHCYRLLTEAAFRHTLPEHTLPEVARCDLKDAILLLKCLGIDDVGAFEFVTQPSQASMELALEELYALNAVDVDARVLEPHGPRMAHGPLPVVLMRLLLLATEAAFECGSEAATICSMLTLQPPWLASSSTERLNACKESFAVYEGDLVTALNIFRQYEMHREDHEWAKRHLLNTQLLERAARVRQQLVRYLQRFDLPLKSCEHDVVKLQRLACAALFLNAARRMPSGTYALCRPVDERRAPDVRFQLHHSSVLAGVEGSAPADFLVFGEALCAGDSAGLRSNTRIRPEWLPELAPHYYKPEVVGAGASEDR